MPGPRRALTAARRLAGTAACLWLAGWVWAASAQAPIPAGVAVDPLGVFVWRDRDEDFGGFSGLELSDDGARFWALSDRATIRWGSVQRDDQGRISGLTTAGSARLQDSRGRKLQPGYQGDSEGLAIDAKGRIFVSFEGMDRIARYDDPDRPAVRVPSAPGFADLGRNSGLEALAVTPSGDLLTMPEVWSRPGEGYPVWRLRDGRWDHPFDLPRDAGWLPVGADVGPDGKLYVLERDFHGLVGFSSRVRRYAMDAGTLGPPEPLIQSVPMQFDNLEGIAVWRDGQGIRITMVSDDNFLFVQRTELVEFRVRERPAGKPDAGPAASGPGRAPADGAALAPAADAAPEPRAPDPDPVQPPAAPPGVSGGPPSGG